MASLRLKRFANAAVLRRIDAVLLVQFLLPFRDFLTGRGMPWPTGPGSFDYEALASILMTPTLETPERLLDALYFVDGLSDGECYDRLLEEARAAGIDLPATDPSPEDLTLIVWLAAPEILERVHAERNRVRPKKFASFFASRTDRPDALLPEGAVGLALEADLNEWFEFRKKGRGARVFAFPREDGLWFLVRHGQRIKREGTVESDGDPGSVFYRPEKFDVLIYYPETGELAIHADTKGERGAYCRCFGRRLFGDPGFFLFGEPLAKYTLRPLVAAGRDALACGDVEGVESIRLYELHIRHASDQKEIEVWLCDDVFKALADHQRDLESEQGGITLVRAKFEVTFSDGRQRSVTVEPPNSASFDRETDNSMIHDWLARRGFIATTDAEGDAHVVPGAVLDVA